MPFLYILLDLGAALLYLAYVACAVPIGALSAFAAYSARNAGHVLHRAWGTSCWPGSRAARARQRRPKMPADADPAIRQYFYGPAVADAGHALRTAYRDGRRFWRTRRRLVGSAFTADGAVLTWPFGVGAAVGMVAGTAVGAVAAAGCACVHLLAVGVSRRSGAGGGDRAADRRLGRAPGQEHPDGLPESCYGGCPIPLINALARTVPGRHRDIRPGRFGILRRRCQCGEPMKTLLLFGSAGMSAYCPLCDHALEHGPGKAPEIVLPFFGAAGAGKTRLLFSMVAQLQLWSKIPTPEAGRREERLTVEFGDSATTPQARATPVHC